ncbi:hypothetical protein TSAR_000256 [Trichomalopsis sarcophagae]|uniref:Reverse transcriptase domain-containing protein n=1 Tax=Trichomalopsis sarcophagae TaxID=543379 RepID=A0A232EQV2_9HYME|nr:hypothetical protein TSAR_000256 [Trichomalopsis sarcophagae]
MAPSTQKRMRDGEQAEEESQSDLRSPVKKKRNSISDSSILPNVHSDDERSGPSEENILAIFEQQSSNKYYEEATGPFVVFIFDSRFDHNLGSLHITSVGLRIFKPGIRVAHLARAGSRKFSLTFESFEEANHFVETGIHEVDSNWRTFIPNNGMYITGIIFGVGSEATGDDILAGLYPISQNVIDKVERIYKVSKTKDNVPLLFPTDKVKIFAKDKLPKYISMFGVFHRVFYFVPAVLRCYNCQRFGHGSGSCRIDPRCVNCGDGEHLASDRACIWFEFYREVNSTITEMDDREVPLGSIGDGPAVLGSPFSRGCSLDDGSSSPLSQDEVTSPRQGRAASTGHFNRTEADMVDPPGEVPPGTPGNKNQVTFASKVKTKSSTPGSPQNPRPILRETQLGHGKLAGRMCGAPQFAAQHNMWGSEIENGLGRTLRSALESSPHFYILNKSATRIHSKTSCPDISLTSPDLYSCINWKVDVRTPAIESANDINCLEVYATLIKIIYESIAKAGGRVDDRENPLRKTKKRPNNSMWWDKSCSALFDERREALSNNKGFRPIALSNCLLKILERVINDRMQWFTENKNILSNSFYGFRRNRSYYDCLSILDLDIRIAKLRNLKLRVLSLDLEGAYDMVNLEKLLTVLIEIKIPPKLLSFIKNLINNRELNAFYNGTKFNQGSANKGLPQGAILSPLLFNIYIIALINMVPHNIKTLSFADDIIIYCSDSNTTNITKSLSKNLR